MKKFRGLLMVLFVAAMGFAGGKGEEAPAMEEAAPAAEMAKAPVVYRLAIGAEPPTLDPSLSEDTTSHNVLLGLFEGLLIHDPKTNDGIPRDGGELDGQRRSDCLHFQAPQGHLE